MRRIPVGLGFLAGALFLAGSDAHACRDKFLVVGRSVRCQRAHGAVQRASILVYLDAGGRLQAAMKEMQLEPNLRLAGHTLRSVAGRAELDEQARSGRYDIVLADISEMVALEGEVGSSPARPVLLPVIYNPTGEELAEAKAEFSCVMRSPSTNKHYLAVIDDAMVQRKKRAQSRKHK